MANEQKGEQDIRENTGTFTDFMNHFDIFKPTSKSTIQLFITQMFPHHSQLNALIHGAADK